VATHDYVIANGTGAAVRSDLNGALAAIVSQNSSASAPATTYAYMLWADTTAGIMKMRNGANSAWISLWELDGTFIATDISLSAGTAGAPSLYFTGDTNTGIYSPGADQVAITTGGSNRLQIDSSGNVGINGTIAGTAKLQVSGALRLFGSGDGTETSNVCLFQASGGGLGFGVNSSQRMILDSSGRLGIGTTTPSTKLQVDNPVSLSGSGNDYCLLAGNTSSASRRAVAIGVDGVSGNAVVAAYNTFSPGYGSLLIDGNDLQFRILGTERARIDSSGRLLVGTSSSRTVGDARALQVEGTDGATAGLSVFRNSNNSSSSIFVFGKSRGTAAGGTTVVQSGDGIGEIQFWATDGTNPQPAAIVKAEVDGTPGANDMPGRLVFSTTADGAASPTERMRINSNGIFKATNTGDYQAVSGNFHELRNNSSGDETAYLSHTHASNPLGVVIRYANATPNGTSNPFLSCSDPGSLRAAIRSNGGLANFSANNANLSDRNAKKDISPAADTWNCLKEWEIVNYRYKDQPDDADLNLGVIAQQVAESCPEVITIFQEAKEATDDAPAQEERLGVKEQQMYWMAIKALQEAQVRIEQLESKVAALEGA